MSIIGGDIVTAAVMEIGSYSPGESISPADMTWGIQKLNRIVDGWDTERNNIYSMLFTTFNLVPNLAPHTIGIAANSPTFVVTGNRPVKIEAANLVLTGSSPTTNTPINIRDADWWMVQTVQSLATNYPTDLFYNPAWPNGELWFWPVPTITRPVQLEFWNTLTQFTQFGQFDMPPGYWDALIYTLAEELTPSFQAPVNPLLVSKASKARARIKGLNSQSPRISSGGDGLPTGGSGNRSSFSYLTGFNVGR